MSQNKPEREILLLALQAGRILLENGAEIFRVEDTVYRICGAYGIQSASVFVLSNGIFLTAGSEEEPQFAKVLLIPVNRANLSRVAEVNQLSRRIEVEKCPPAVVKAELERIELLPGFPPALQILAAGIGGACFCVLFHGGMADVICTFFFGMLIQLYLLRIGARYFSKIVCNILGGICAALLSILCYRLQLGERLDSMMIGSIILMVPGMAFTNAIRDMADGDYISGSVRMLDAVLVFFCIAMGVGLVIALYGHVTGGVLL